MKHFLAALAVAALSLCLSGCVFEPGGPDVRVNLPKTPEYYRSCFTQLTAMPATNLTRERVVTLIAQLRQSEKRKSQCGKNLLDWYLRVQLAVSKKGT